MPRNQAKELFGQWLVKGKPIKSRTDALCLAQALRHATVHGALSATKVREWGDASGCSSVWSLKSVPFVRPPLSSSSLPAEKVTDWERTAPKMARFGALSVRQPHAEAIIRGIKPIEFRTRATKVRGRVYIYASYTRYSAVEEDEMMQDYGLEDVACEKLRRGVVIGTVDLHDCSGEPGDHHWHLQNPQRLKKPRTPDNHPQPMWFTPFNT